MARDREAADVRPGVHERGALREQVRQELHLVLHPTPVLHQPVPHVPPPAMVVRALITW